MELSVRPLVRGAFRVALACAAVLTAFATIELGYRVHSQRPVLVLDDWRAGRISNLAFGDRGRFDPALGWAPSEGYESDGYNTLDHGIRRNFCEEDVRTGGILAVGDVFTDGGTEVKDDETWPAILERMTGQPVLNGGVAGYGSDQIVMRAEQLMALVEPETLVVALLDDSIARAGLASFGASKPYYTLDQGNLAYHAPMRRKGDEEGQSVWRARTRDVLGHSAVLDVVLSRVAPSYWLGMAGEPVFRSVDNDPVGVTCALLQRLKTRADTDGVRVLVLMQHVQQAVAEKTEPQEGVTKVAACAASMAIEVVDQFEQLRATAVANPEDLGDYYLQGDGEGQMSRKGNLHAAQLLVRALEK
jgi:hypothetical protein